MKTIVKEMMRMKTIILEHDFDDEDYRKLESLVLQLGYENVSAFLEKVLEWLPVALFALVLMDMDGDNMDSFLDQLRPYVDKAIDEDINGGR